MATNFSPRLVNSNPEPVSGMPLSIALISPNGRQREAAAEVLAGCTGYEVVEFPSYPERLDQGSELMDQRFGVVIIDLDGDPEFALQLVESISADGFATVMVYSETADPELLVRCMRAGAREFLTLPLVQRVMEEALQRAAGRQPWYAP